MLEPGQDLALAEEPGQDLIGVHPPLDELEGHLLLELAVGALRPPYRSHPPAADLLQKAIPSDQGPLGFPRLARLADPRGEGRGKTGRGRFQEIPLDQGAPSLGGRGHATSSR